jgi:imidazolonepropionase-like amidohydrolase
MRALVLALALLAAPGAAQDPALGMRGQQDRIALTGGRVVTNAGAPIEGGTVLIAGGEVAGVLPAGGAVPPGYRAIDVSGKWVTPGVVAGLSQIGAAEVHAEDRSNDVSAGNSPASAALEIGLALNPEESSVAITRAEGVTAAIVAPGPGRTLFAGQGAVMSLGEGAPLLRPRAFQYVTYGEAGARIAGGSRPAAWAEITNALEEARRLQNGLVVPMRDQHRDLRVTREDAEALTLVLRGAQPLLVRVDRASDIRQVLKLAQMYPGLRLVLVSAHEGWMVADDIARARVPVVTLGMDNLPGQFEQLGATMSNVGRLVAAGVTVALGTPDLDASFQPRLLPHYAGNLVGQGRVPGGVGLSWDQAFAAISLAPARIFGLQRHGQLAAGQAADVVVWSGDPLELATHAERVIVGGREQSLESRQARLARRYAPGRDRSSLPEGYRRP